MAASATVRCARSLTVVAVALTAVLAGAYALGAAAGRWGGATPNAAPTRERTAPTTEPAAPPTAQPSAPPVVADGRPVADGPPLPVERGAPFGSRQTTGSRSVALTFDDGPDPRYTPQTLALLRAWRVKATFCVVGVNVRAYPQLVRAIAADGHTLCNHSWDHDLRLASRPRAYIRNNLSRTTAEIRAAVPGVPVAYYRQPGGRWSTDVVTVARSLGMTPLHWAVDPQDWRRPGPGRIASRVNASTSAGDIVLLHDAGGDRSGTVSALRSILPALIRRFQLVAMPTAAREPDPPAPRPGTT